MRQIQQPITEQNKSETPDFLNNQEPTINIEYQVVQENNPTNQETSIPRISDRINHFWDGLKQSEFAKGISRFRSETVLKIAGVSMLAGLAFGSNLNAKSFDTTQVQTAKTEQVDKNLNKDIIDNIDINTPESLKIGGLYKSFEGSTDLTSADTILRTRDRVNGVNKEISRNRIPNQLKRIKELQNNGKSKAAAIIEIAGQTPETANFQADIKIYQDIVQKISTNTAPESQPIQSSSPEATKPTPAATNKSEVTAKELYPAIVDKKFNPKSLVIIELLKESKALNLSPDQQLKVMNQWLSNNKTEILSLNDTNESIMKKISTIKENQNNARAVPTPSPTPSPSVMQTYNPENTKPTTEKKNDNNLLNIFGWGSAVAGAGALLWNKLRNKKQKIEGDNFTILKSKKELREAQKDYKRQAEQNIRTNAEVSFGSLKVVGTTKQINKAQQKSEALSLENAKKIIKETERLNNLNKQELFDEAMAILILDPKRGGENLKAIDYILTDLHSSKDARSGKLFNDMESIEFEKYLEDLFQPALNIKAYSAQEVAQLQKIFIKSRELALKSKAQNPSNNASANTEANTDYPFPSTSTESHFKNIQQETLRKEIVTKADSLTNQLLDLYKSNPINSHGIKEQINMLHTSMIKGYFDLTKGNTNIPTKLNPESIDKYAIGIIREVVQKSNSTNKDELLKDIRNQMIAISVLHN